MPTLKVHHSVETTTTTPHQADTIGFTPPSSNALKPTFASANAIHPVVWAASTISAADLQKWRTVAYEVRMYFETSSPTNAREEWVLHNAVTESAVVHNRCLAEFLLTGLPKYEKNSRATDVTVRGLFGDWERNPRYDRLKASIKTLDTEYGTNTPNNPRWQFNTLVAHLTENRGDRHDYEEAFKKMRKPIRDCIREIEMLAGVKFAQE